MFGGLTTFNNNWNWGSGTKPLPYGFFALVLNHFYYCVFFAIGNIFAIGTDDGYWVTNLD